MHAAKFPHQAFNGSQMSPQTKYAQSGEVSVAYQVVGDGPIDLVFAPGFISHLEHEWEEPRWAKFTNDLASFARLIKFDKRGTGLSDRTGSLPNMDERMDDIRAVMDAAGSTRAVLLGISEGGAMCQLFAATCPDRVSKLILLGSYANASAAVPELKKNVVSPEQIRQIWGTGAMLPMYAPNLSKDPIFSEWWAKFERLSASPTSVIELRKNNAEIDVTPLLPSIQAPTLVLHRTGDVRNRVEAAREVAQLIPEARLVELPGEDHFVWLDDTGRVIDEIRKFLGGEDRFIETDRVLATVMFTDIVDSTKLASQMGDANWRNVLKTHFALAESEIQRFRGNAVKSLGDGLLATFDGPARAVKCAQSIVMKMRPLGIGVRSGLHTGEVELAGDGDVRGIAVHIASRVSQQAKADQVLVSRTVRDIVAGSGISFDDLGRHELKGLDEPMRLYRVTA
jgi:class 3 adenylate cyclase